MTEIEYREHLKDMIRQECRYFEKLKDNGFVYYMYLNECKNSEESGLYQLILNGHELWHGTLLEIRAIVQSMCIREERNDFFDS